MAMSMKNIKKLRLSQRNFLEKLILETEHSAAAMLSKMTDDNALVEDVMIATWSLACEKIDVLERHENPHGWIMKAAKFKMFKALEKRSRIGDRELLILDKIENYLIEETQTTYELTGMLKSYLSEDEAETLILRYYYEVSYTELAEYFHMSEPALRKRVSRSLKKLRKVVKEDWYK